MKHLHPTTQKLGFQFLTLLIGTFSLLEFSGCSFGGAYGALGGASLNSMAMGNGLTVSPASTSVAINSHFTFTATGGTAPYTFTIYGGTGSITTDGNYTAPGVNEVDTVQVIDSHGSQAFASVTVGSTSIAPGPGVNPLAVNPPSLTVLPGSITQFSASGGAGAYTFSRYSGNGAVSVTGVFTAPLTNETDYIQVNDQNGGVAWATIIISNANVSPSVEVYRYVNTSGLGDHYYATSNGAVANYSMESASFKLFPDSTVPGTIPLYRCRRTNNTHFLTSDTACGGATFEANLGYMYSYAATGMVPLHSYISPTFIDTLATLNQAEGQNVGYIYEGVLGYVGNP